MFEGYGMDGVDVVEVDGGGWKDVVKYKVLERLGGESWVVIEFGGGMKRDEELEIGLERGGEMVRVGRMGVKEGDRLKGWMEVYGNEGIMLGGDGKEGKIGVKGWLEWRGVEVMGLLDEYIKKGVRKVVWREMCGEGMVKGGCLEV